MSGAINPPARQEVPRGIFNRIREHLQPRLGNFGILELGPGTGRFSQEAVCTFSGVTSYALIDSDKNWLRHSQRLVKQACPSATVMSFWLSKPPEKVLEGQQFDRVHCHALIVQLRPRAIFSYLGFLANLTSPGGLLVFDCFSSDQVDELLSMSGTASWATFIHPQWLEQILVSLDFEVVEVQKFSYGESGSSQYWICRKRQVN